MKQPERFEPELAVALVLAMEVVRHGGKLCLVGAGPLSSPSQARYEGSLSSHSGARYVAATGDTMAACLDELMRRWGKL